MHQFLKFILVRNKKILKLAWFFQLFTYLSPQLFFPYTVTVLVDMSYNFSHWRTNSVNFSSISEDKNRQQCSGGDVRLFTLSDSSRYRQVRTRSVTSDILAQQRRRNGTETWRRRSCQCEHLRKITHGKILLNGDVPRRNGNVTYSVNRP